MFGFQIEVSSNIYWMSILKFHWVFTEYFDLGSPVPGWYHIIIVTRNPNLTQRYNDVCTTKGSCLYVRWVQECGDKLLWVPTGICVGTQQGPYPLYQPDHIGAGSAYWAIEWITFVIVTTERRRFSHQWNNLQMKTLSNYFAFLFWPVLIRLFISFYEHFYISVCLANKYITLQYWSVCPKTKDYWFVYPRINTLIWTG